MGPDEAEFSGGCTQEPQESVALLRGCRPDTQFLRIFAPEDHSQRRFGRAARAETETASLVE